MKRLALILLLVPCLAFGQSVQKQAFQEVKVDTVRPNHYGPNWHIIFAFHDTIPMKVFPDSVWMKKIQVGANGSVVDSIKVRTDSVSIYIGGIAYSAYRNPPVSFTYDTLNHNSQFAKDTTYKAAQLLTKVAIKDTTTRAPGSYITPTQFVADTNRNQNIDTSRTNAVSQVVSQNTFLTVAASNGKTARLTIDSTKWATAALSGFLKGSDWYTFNAKQSALFSRAGGTISTLTSTDTLGGTTNYFKGHGLLLTDIPFWTRSGGTLSTTTITDTISGGHLKLGGSSVVVDSVKPPVTGSAFQAIYVEGTAYYAKNDSSSSSTTTYQDYNPATSFVYFDDFEDRSFTVSTYYMQYRTWFGTPEATQAPYTRYTYPSDSVSVGVLNVPTQTNGYTDWGSHVESQTITKWSMTGARPWVMEFRMSMTDTTYAHFNAGIKSSTALDGAGVYFHKDNGQRLTAWTKQSSATTTSLGVVDLTVWHDYKIQWTSSGIKFYIDGSLLATHTTNIPTNNSDMFMQFYSNSYNQPGDGSDIWWNLQVDWLRLQITGYAR